MSETTTGKLTARKVQEEMSANLEALQGSFNDALNDTDNKISEIGKQVSELSNTLTIFVKNFQNSVDAQEQDLGRPQDIEHDFVLETPDTDDINSPAFKAKQDHEMFMKEKVTISIGTTNDKFADKIFNISVNGTPFTFIRGNEYTVPRYVVEGLCRCKPIHYDNEEYVDTDGTKKVRQPSSTGLRYDFSVIEDRNPRGRAWLRSVLAQP